MKISVSHNYEELSSRATADMVESLGGLDRKLVCVASGDSPKGMYRKLTELVASGELDISNWDFIGLDEWVGLNEKDEGSCGEFLHEFIVQPLNLPAKRYCLLVWCAYELRFLIIRACCCSESFIVFIACLMSRVLSALASGGST
jgi:galactosamine-6-phosphate isomerase